MRLRATLSTRSIFIVLMVASVATTLLGPRAAEVLRRPAMFILAPLGDGSMYLASWVRGRSQDLVQPDISQEEARRLREANEILERQTAAAGAEIRNLQQQIVEIQGLRRRLFASVEDVPCELIPARVVAADAIPYGQTRVVNARRAPAGAKLTTRLVQTDRSKALAIQSRTLAVLPPTLGELAGEALIGRVIDAGEFTARVQLVTDRGFETRARIWRRLDPEHPRMIHDGLSVKPLSEADNAFIDVRARGDGVDSLIVPDVKGDYNVLPGDWLVTCNDDPLLPAQILIGRVVEVLTNVKPSGFATLKVRPAADLDTLRTAYVAAAKGVLGGPAAGEAR